jgi:hypothetical protein
MEDSVSDVRQCEACGKYLVLSRHDACNAPTKPVDTKKVAHCRDCFHTKPEEWDALPAVFKKADLIKCWRVTPFEAVPKTGKRCFRWLSERFDPDGDEPVDELITDDASESELSEQEPKPPVVSKEEEHNRRLSEAARKRPPKYNFTDEMLCRAKELRTQEKPWPMSAILVLINKEFSTGYANNPTVEAAFRGRLVERFPELKGIKAERRDARGKIKTPPEALKERLDETKAKDEAEESYETAFERIATPENIARAETVVENTKKAIKAGCFTPYESICESAEEIEVRMPVAPTVEGAPEYEFGSKTSPKREPGDLWRAIAAPAEEEIIIPEQDPDAYFSVCFGVDAEYACEVKSASKDTLNVEIPGVGEVRLKWGTIRTIFLAEPVGDTPRGEMMLESKIERAIEKYHSRSQKEAKK